MTDAAMIQASSPARRKVPDALRALLPQMVADGRSDAEIAARWGLEAWQVACARRALGLRSSTGWPVTDAELRRLVLVERLTDGEIAQRYGVGARTVEVHRLQRLVLRRSHDPRPEARRSVVRMSVHRLEMTPIERALAALGRRVMAGSDGYRLDGRCVSVVDVLRAGGVVA